MTGAVVHPGARERLARLRQRAVPANAGPAVKSRAVQALQKVRALSLADLRAVAAGQIDKARDAWERAAEVPWTAGLYVRFVNAARWRPFRKLVEEAELALANGDLEKVEADQRRRYVTAWQTAVLAVDQIAAEAHFGATDFYYLGGQLWDGVKELASEAADQAKKALEPALGGLGWLGLGALALLALRGSRP